MVDVGRSEGISDRRQQRCTTCNATRLSLHPSHLRVLRVRNRHGERHKNISARHPTVRWGAVFKFNLVPLCHSLTRVTQLPRNTRSHAAAGARCATHKSPADANISWWFCASGTKHTKKPLTTATVLLPRGPLGRVAGVCCANTKERRLATPSVVRFPLVRAALVLSRWVGPTRATICVDPDACEFTRRWTTRDRC